MARRMEPPKIPTWLPCGCMAMGTRKKVNRESLTLKGGRKVCHHGTVWALAWTEAGKVSGNPGRPRKGTLQESN